MLTELNLKNLKLKIKKWEKKFVSKNGYKPCKSDIDSDPSNIRKYYKDYWALVKANRKVDFNHNTYKNQKENKQTIETWSKDLNKQPKSNQKELKVTKTQHFFSNKLFNHFMKENSDIKSNYSLKKKLKSRKLLPVDKNLSNNEQQIDEFNKSDTYNILIDQSNLCFKSPINQSLNNQELNHCKSILNEDSSTSIFPDQYEQPNFLNYNQNDLNSVVNNIIESLSESDSKSNSDNQMSANNEIINFEKQCCENVNILLSSDASKNCQPSASPIAADKNLSTLFSSLMRKSLFSNYSNEPSQDFCIFENESESQKRKLEEASQVSFHETKKIRIDPVDIYEFVVEEDEKENESKKKVTFNIPPKKKVKKNLKMLEANYRKIDLKKKVFSRGFKKFNTRRMKRNAWKKKQKQDANKCFKCDQEGHYANNCLAFVDFDENLGKEEKEKFNDLIENFSDIRANAQPILSSENADYSQLMQEALEELGFNTFKKNQNLTIARILKGQSTLFVSSTGSGKSLCYQIPAYLFAKYKKYITIVISPLISLMEDQLKSLPKKLKGVCLHSNMNVKQKEINISLLQNGQAQVLFISPESIVNGNGFYDLVKLPTIAFVCIDEAHCLSEWSNNFRPSYLQLCQIFNSKLKVKTFLALTATATLKTCHQVCRNLKIQLQDVIGTTQIPENLILTVSHDTNKDQALIDLLQSPRFVNLSSIIIYCTRRETTERLATLIRISMQDVKSSNFKASAHGLTWDAQSYHAGLTSEERFKIQKRFAKNELRIIVATIAFGMGINKSNVGAVIHYNMPKNFESYVQEIGRAGRDNSIAYCHLFLNCDGTDLFELQRHIYANTADRHQLRKLIEKVFKKCKCSFLNKNCETKDDDFTCPGHELALPINNLTLELDMKVENILTILSFIELNFPEFKLRLLSSVDSTCKLHCFFSNSEQITQLTSTCFPVALALAMSKNKDEILSNLEFNYVEIASMLGRDSNQVRRQLKNLEWFQDSNGKWRKSGIKIEFSNPSIRVKSRGTLNNSQLDSILSFVYNYNQSLEWIEIKKLKYIYSIFKQISQAKFTNKVNLIKSNQLKQTINDYFNNENLNKELDLENWLTSKSVLEFNDSNQTENKNSEILSVYNIEQARKDVRDLISIYKKSHDLTARGIARILQGISSPRFPAEIWSKCKRFWRSNINIDFNELVKLANEELLRLKNLN